MLQNFSIQCSFATECSRNIYRQLQNCPLDHQVQNNVGFIQLSLKLRIIWPNNLNHTRDWYMLPLIWMSLALSLKDHSSIDHIIPFSSWQTLVLCRDQICQHVKCLFGVRNKDVQKKKSSYFQLLTSLLLLQSLSMQNKNEVLTDWGQM